jgi:hypothetical protein
MNAKRITTFIDRRFSVKIFEVIVIILMPAFVYKNNLYCIKSLKHIFLSKEKLRESSYGMLEVKNAENNIVQHKIFEIIELCQAIVVHVHLEKILI